MTAISEIGNRLSRPSAVIASPPRPANRTRPPVIVFSDRINPAPRTSPDASPAIR
jgi:hypothetical protein